MHNRTYKSQMLKNLMGSMTGLLSKSVLVAEEES
jgi:hypothetical protein